MPALKIASLPPPRTPEREALAVLIERLAAAVQQLAANETAQETLRQAIRTGNRTVEKAQAAISEAQRNSARHLAAVALGTAGDPPQTLKAARAAAEEAQEDLASAEEALAALEADHKELARSISIKRSLLHDRVAAVVASEPGVGRLLATFDQKRRELEELRLTVASISLFVPLEHRHWEALRSYPEARANPVWRDALTALSVDADAPLPK